MRQSAQRPAEWSTPPGWRAIDFISDLHLADDTPNTFAAWSKYLRESSADAIVILGDLFEAWVGDDSRFDAFEARSAEVLRDAASRRSISFMVGNRDFLVGGDLLDACGMRGLDDPTLIIAFDERVLVTHGDAMCIADTAYQTFRRVVRDAAWQRDFLSRPLEERRAFGRAARARSEEVKATSGLLFDVDRETALDALTAAGATTMIHGHTHRPGTEALGRGYQRFVLSDWDADHPGVARAEVLRWQATGFERLTPEQALRATC